MLRNNCGEKNVDSKLIATFFELVYMLYHSEDEKLWEFADDIIWIATKDYYGL